MSLSPLGFIESDDLLEYRRNKTKEKFNNSIKGENMNSLNGERQSVSNLVKVLFENPTQTKQLLKHLVEAGREALDAVDNILKTNYVEDTLKELASIPIAVEAIMAAHQQTDNMINNGIKKFKRKQLFVKTALEYPVYVGTAKLSMKNCRTHLDAIDKILSPIFKTKEDEDE